MYARSANNWQFKIHSSQIFNAWSQRNGVRLHALRHWHQVQKSKALWPGDWKTIASARKKGESPTMCMIFREMISLTFAEIQLTMTKTDTNNKPVQFQKLCWFQFKKENEYFGLFFQQM